MSSAAVAVARRAKEAALLWIAGFREACCLHRVVFFCSSSRTLLIRTGQCFLLNGLIFLGRYKWNFLGVSLNKRLDFFESNWAFFSGFGSLCVLPTFFFSPLVSYGVMAILYPLFVLTAAGTEAEDVIESRRKSWGGEPEKLQIFYVARRFSTLVLRLFPEARKEH